MGQCTDCFTTKMTKKGAEFSPAACYLFGLQNLYYYYCDKHPENSHTLFIAMMLYPKNIEWDIIHIKFKLFNNTWTVETEVIWCELFTLFLFVWVFGILLEYFSEIFYSLQPCPCHSFTNTLRDKICDVLFELIGRGMEKPSCKEKTHGINFGPIIFLSYRCLLEAPRVNCTPMRYFIRQCTLVNNFQWTEASGGYHTEGGCSYIKGNWRS